MRQLFSIITGLKPLNGLGSLPQCWCLIAGNVELWFCSCDVRLEVIAVNGGDWGGVHRRCPGVSMSTLREIRNEDGGR